MPNIKSAKKRVRVIEKKTLINMAHKTALKTAIKKFEAAAKAGNKEEAQQLFNEAAKKLDQSVNRGILPRTMLQERSHSLLLNLQNLRKSHLKELQFCSSFFCT